MVSFQCDACADTVKKPKLDQHRNRCHASFTCLDCSTTFRNPGEYKSHTTCVSEAEKYQGALYKGPKKNGQAQSQPQSQSQTPAPAPIPVPSPAAIVEPTPTASSSIHPSRLNQLNAPEREYPQGGRGGFGGRGGRGGRGGFQRGGYGGVVERSYATDMNKTAPPTGMRSWGGSTENTPKPESEIGTPLENSNTIITSFPDSEKKNKHKSKYNKKSGDKGGTGSKANSKNPPKENRDEEEVEPKNKKRKFGGDNDDEVKVNGESKPSTSTSTAEVGDEEISSKTVKRLKKKIDKLDVKSELNLKDLLNNLGKDSKDSEKNIDQNDILRLLKVSKKDGQFVITL